MKPVADRGDATVMRMFRTIEDLTDLRAIELGIMRIERRVTDLHALVEQVVAGLGHDDRARVDVECRSPLTVLADAARVSRVVARLLHLHLAASSPDTVRIVLERRGERAVIALLGAATAMRDGSLDVRVARHTIEAHGGSLTAYEQPGEGTWLVLALPLPTCDIRRRASAFAASILIVTDDFCRGSALAQSMRDDGFDADFARSGEEATRRIAMACPDALVIAEELADIDGAARIPTVVVRQTEAVFPAPRDGSRPPATSGPHVAWPIELATLYAELDGAIRRSIRIAI